MNNMLFRSAMLSFVLVHVALPEAAIGAPKCDSLLTKAQVKERGARLKGLLAKKLYAALDDELQTRQSKIERGEDSDELLRLDFDAAFDSDPAMEPLLSEWVSLRRRSYPAHVARAYHYVNSGYAKRGSGFSDNTSEEQFDAMKQQFGKARADLNEAARLSEKPTIANAKEFFVARSRAYDAGTASEILAEANKKFPTSLAIKVAATSALNPKWGGSFDELDRLFSFAQTARMSADDLAVLKYRIELEKGDYYEVVTRQMANAATHYRLAGEACESANAWVNAMRVSYAIEDWANVIVAASRSLNLDPTDGYSFQRRGWAYEKTKRMDQAVKDYETAAGIGIPWAQNKLGWILWQGTDAPKDLARARKLFELAAASGDSNAPVNLKALNAAIGKN